MVERGHACEDLDSNRILTKHFLDTCFFLRELPWVESHQNCSTVCIVLHPPSLCLCVCVCVCVCVCQMHTCNLSLLKGSIRLISSLHISLRSFPTTSPVLFLLGGNSPSLNNRSSSSCAFKWAIHYKGGWSDGQWAGPGPQGWSGLVGAVKGWCTYLGLFACCLFHHEFLLLRQPTSVGEPVGPREECLHVLDCVSMHERIQ